MSLMTLIVACAPRPPTTSKPPSVPAGGKQEAPVDKSEWTWVDPQGVTRTYEQLSSRLREIMAECGVPGLSIVLKQGRSWYSYPDTYHFDMGAEVPESGRPVNARSVFRADRLGQTIIAYLVLRLVTDAQFDLDRPLSNDVSRSAIEGSLYEDLARDHRYSQLTARRILSHQSGLANSRLDRADKRLTFVSPPGRGFAYSDEGYKYLEFALEQKFGRGLDELAKTYVFDPLGLTQSRFSRQAPSRKAVAEAAKTGLGSGRPDPDPGWGFFTTALDFTNFMWTVRMGGGDLSYQTYMSYLIYPTIGVRTPAILAPDRSEGRPVLPPHLAWCLGWGTYQVPKIELGACSFIGEKGRNVESYATVFLSQHSTALTIFIVPSSSGSAMPLILREILGEMENPLSWLGFQAPLVSGPRPALESQRRVGHG